jgi:ABC-type sugar transport system substrate-binding protein
MKKIFLLTLIVFFVTAGISFAQKKEYRFGLALQTLQNPFYLSLRQGLTKQPQSFQMSNCLS